MNIRSYQHMFVHSLQMRFNILSSSSYANLFLIELSAMPHGLHAPDLVYFSSPFLPVDPLLLTPPHFHSQQYVNNVMRRATDEADSLRAIFGLRESLDSYTWRNYNHTNTTNSENCARSQSGLNTFCGRFVGTSSSSFGVSTSTGVIGLLSDLVTVPDPRIARPVPQPSCCPVHRWRGQRDGSVRLPHQRSLRGTGQVLAPQHAPLGKHRAPATDMEQLCCCGLCYRCCRLRYRPKVGGGYRRQPPTRAGMGGIRPAVSGTRDAYPGRFPGVRRAPLAVAPLAVATGTRAAAMDGAVGAVQGTGYVRLPSRHANRNTSVVVSCSLC